VAVRKNPSANLTINPQEIIMTITNYLPQWLARRLTVLRRRRVANAGMKKRQALPTLPKTERANHRFQDDDSPAGHRIQWRL